MTGISIAKSLELHALAPLATRAEVAAVCEQAGAAHLAAVCVWPAHVVLAADVLSGSDTRVRAAIGFPYGQDVPDTKIAACERALGDGAHELAVMVDHSAVGESTGVDSVRSEIERFVQHQWWSALVSARGRAELTLVVETMGLPRDDIAALVRDLQDTAVGFLQTGTGLQTHVVTEQHIRMLRDVLPEDVAVVAVGGIATLAEAQELISAGAVRVGSGGALAIRQEEMRRMGLPLA